MKVTLRARPLFEFAITKPQLQCLMRLAKGHYDGECQRAAMSISHYKKQVMPGDVRSVEPRNGLLVIWQHHFDYATLADEGQYVTVNSDELDLLCKITEVSEMALEMRSAWCVAYHAANEQIPKWTLELETK
jgi:hypothetical protein